MKSPRIIIVGGGVIGLSIAWELAGRGVHVTLLERGKLGKATSWAAAGILPPANRQTATDPMDRLRGMSHEMFPDWCNRLKELTQIDSGLRRCGGWYLSETAGERAAMIGMTDYWDQMQIECESIELDEVAAREPLLKSWCKESDRHAAWWVPDEYQIRTPRLLQALSKACRTSGVVIHESYDVDGIQLLDSSVTVSSRDHRLEADAIVLCGGSHTGLIDAQIRLEKSLIPIRGQILLLKTERPLFRTVMNFGYRYLIGREDGNVLVGSCEEEVGFREGTTETMLATLRQFANRVCPALRDAETVMAWSGLRPMTFDGFPMLGRVPRFPNVYVASGHYRSGVHLSPATAVTMADTILGKVPAIDLEPFRVGKQQQ